MTTAFGLTEIEAPDPSMCKLLAEHSRPDRPAPPVHPAPQQPPAGTVRGLASPRWPLARHIISYAPGSSGPPGLALPVPEGGSLCLIRSVMELDSQVRSSGTPRGEREAGSFPSIIRSPAKDE